MLRIYQAHQETGRFEILQRYRRRSCSQVGHPKAVYRRVLSGEVTMMIVSRPLLTELGRALVDNRILDAAAEGVADVVVSGDRHLLSLGLWRGIPIVNPVGFPGEA